MFSWTKKGAKVVAAPADNEPRTRTVTAEDIERAFRQLTTGSYDHWLLNTSDGWACLCILAARGLGDDVFRISLKNGPGTLQAASEIAKDILDQPKPNFITHPTAPIPGALVDLRV